MDLLQLILLIVLFPISVFFIVGIIWKYLLKRSQKLAIYRKQKSIRQYFNPSEKPFREYQYPAMFLSISALIFILIVTGFGVKIDVRTGQTIFEMNWSQCIGKDGTFDSWVYSPYYSWVSRNRELVIGMFMAGFYGTLIFTIYIYFEYLKWKWKHFLTKKEKIGRARDRSNM